MVMRARAIDGPLSVQTAIAPPTNAGIANATKKIALR
jgi:hypothetical protein